MELDLPNALISCLLPEITVEWPNILRCNNLWNLQNSIPVDILFTFFFFDSLSHSYRLRRNSMRFTFLKKKFLSALRCHPKFSFNQLVRLCFNVPDYHSDEVLST